MILGGRSVSVGTGGVEWSEGRPLVALLHGAGQDHTVWALQARALAQRGWNVAALDFPGHGRSQDNPSLDSVAAYSSWTARLLDHLRDRDGAGEGSPVPSTIVGHSMGACIALTLAASEPDLVSKMVLIGAGARMPVNPALLDDTLNRPEQAHRFITAFGHGRRTHLGGSQTPGVWNLGAATALLERCPAEVLHRDFAACDAWRGECLASKVLCPTLVIAGGGDRMTPPKAGRDLAERIRRASFEVIEDSGHMMMAEATSQVSQLLLDFL